MPGLGKKSSTLVDHLDCLRGFNLGLEINFILCLTELDFLLPL